jgi:hypothetical protein
MWIQLLEVVAYPPKFIWIFYVFMNISDFFELIQNKSKENEKFTVRWASFCPRLWRYRGHDLAV